MTTTYDYEKKISSLEYEYSVLLDEKYNLENENNRLKSELEKLKVDFSSVIGLLEDSLTIKGELKDTKNFIKCMILSLKNKLGIVIN